ncbi:MAG: chorismate synthase [Clostridiaceae bacterium]|nr:chorismate synthase [Clostridiaceae bacterium]
MSSMWGNKVKISLFGESHGVGIGVVIDGLPSGIDIDMQLVTEMMERRAPGRYSGSTSRKEPDIPKVMSGLYRGKTTGTPLCAVIENTDTRSSDYEKTAMKPRPGHADLTGMARYGGANDPRGGGHFSARIMAGFTFAGAVCRQILEKKGVKIFSHIYSISNIEDEPYNPVEMPSDVSRKSFPVLDEAKGLQMQECIIEASRQLDSVGGIVECMATGFPAGLGRPIFGNIESRLASILYAIPAVKGVEFGSGFEVARSRGSINNDHPHFFDNGIRLRSNHAGGVEGGISNGMPVLFRCAFKPTPSIAQAQDTVNLDAMKNDTIEIRGRHDACVVPRALPIVEAAAAICLLDVFEEG